MDQPLRRLGLMLMLCFINTLPTYSLETDIPPGPKWDAFDKTTETPEDMPMDRMIIVTVSSEWHKSLVQDRSVKDNPLPSKYKAFLEDIQNRYGLQRTADWPLHALKEHCFVFTAKSNAHRNEAMRQLMEDNRFNKVTPVSRFKTSGNKEDLKTIKPSSSKEVPYNDPYFHLQFSFDKLNLRPFHTQTQGEDIVIAVIDTGVDIHHQEMQGRIQGTKNVVDKDDQQFLKDLHGTAVSSIIAANANNHVGMVGMAPQAKLIGIKACWEDNPEHHGAVCSSFNIIKALDFALKQKAHIINMSLAGPNDDILEALIHQAEAQGTLIIGSIDPSSSKSFPTMHSEVLAVAHPKQFQPGTRVDILAPGKKIISAIPNNEYEFFSGNSFASAHVSGLFALIKSHFKDINMLELRDEIKKNKPHKIFNTCVFLNSFTSNPAC